MKRITSSLFVLIIVALLGYTPVACSQSSRDNAQESNPQSSFITDIFTKLLNPKPSNTPPKTIVKDPIIKDSVIPVNKENVDSIVNPLKEEVNKLRDQVEKNNQANNQAINILSLFLTIFVFVIGFVLTLNKDAIQTFVVGYIEDNTGNDEGKGTSESKNSTQAIEVRLGESIKKSTHILTERIEKLKKEIQVSDNSLQKKFDSLSKELEQLKKKNQQLEQLISKLPGTYAHLANKNVGSSNVSSLAVIRISDISSNPNQQSSQKQLTSQAVAREQNKYPCNDAYVKQLKSTSTHYNLNWEPSSVYRHEQSRNEPIFLYSVLSGDYAFVASEHEEFEKYPTFYYLHIRNKLVINNIGSTLDIFSFFFDVDENTSINARTYSCDSWEPALIEYREDNLFVLNRKGKLLLISGTK
jgi:hypothetical protein